jgi:hypothetical protein
MGDPYRVLNLAPGASREEIKAAFRRAALRHHPDMHAGASDSVKQSTEAKFQEINEAYAKLTNGAPRGSPPLPALTPHSLCSPPPPPLCRELPAIAEPGARRLPPRL